MESLPWPSRGVLSGGAGRVWEVQVPGCSSSPPSQLLVAVLDAHFPVLDDLHDSARDE